MRGEQCTSSDAAGFPVAQLLFNADEVASGVIDHAIRFILPNARMRASTYVHPASHAGAPSAPSPAPIYGSRWRLRSTFNDATYSTAAKVVIAALKKYGMFLADGGNIALTAQSDDFTVAKWATMNFDSHSLYGILPADFEVVQTTSISPTRITLTYDCVPNNLPKLTCGSPTPSPPTSPNPPTAPTPSPTPNCSLKYQACNIKPCCSGLVCKSKKCS
jgi:serine/threonine-protein kinase